jgi:hypothetical protein
MNGVDSHDGQHLQWSEVGSTSKELQALMRELYWTGVKRDILDIIRTLRTWRGDEYRDVLLNEDQLCVGRDPKMAFGLGTFLSRACFASNTHKLLVILILRMEI